jgi:16S rRNA processing protein RimM
VTVSPDPGAPRPRLQVGRIGRAHGLRGEVAVTFTSNRPERTLPGASVFAAERELVIVAARPHQGRMLVCFAGIDDRTAAEALLGTVLTADPLDPDEAALADGEYWVHELVGSAVVDRAGQALGEVVAVEANPAHDLLVLASGALVPIVFVVEQREGAVVIDPPDGLFDL